MTIEELQEKRALVKKLKCELKNEEMALVLLKKLKQSQTVASREQTVVSGGATLTPTNLGLGKGPARSDSKGYSNKNIDLLTADKIVSILTGESGGWGVPGEKERITECNCLSVFSLSTPSLTLPSITPPCWRLPVWTPECSVRWLPTTTPPRGRETPSLRYRNPRRTLRLSNNDRQLPSWP